LLNLKRRNAAIRDQQLGITGKPEGVRSRNDEEAGTARPGKTPYRQKRSDEAVRPIEPPAQAFDVQKWIAMANALSKRWLVSRHDDRSAWPLDVPSSVFPQ